MTEVLTSAQMRAIEQAAIDSGAVTGLDLMERAGAGVVQAILAEWPELATGTPCAVVLCGPGNNGGDGFVVARLLRERGWAVEVFLHGEPSRLPPDAQVNYGRWRQMGEVRPFEEFDPSDDALKSGHAVHSTRLVDALFGIALSRPITGKLASTMVALGQPGPAGRPAIISINVPSGLCADSGRILGAVMPADLVVTFHSPKIGHYLADGPEACSALSIQDIGITACGPRPFDPVQLVPEDPATCSSALDKSHGRDLARARHKYAHGHALIASGDHGHSGAARLAARGALRIGAGLVTIASPPAALAEHAARLDAIMLREMADGAALATLLDDRRITALCLGPALGTGAHEGAILAAALRAPVPAPTRRGLVLDADALTLLARHPDLFAALHGACVLTPHGGEFARLFPDIAERLAAPATKGPAYSKVDATRAAAARAGCTVLFKGPDTVIADPSGRCAINSAAYARAAPWLATAGSGDVLSGFIAGLLARGFDPFDAACTAAWLHVECARSFGPGLIAEDLPEELPKVFRALGL